MTLPGFSCVSAAALWLIAWTLPEFVVVAPEIFMIRPALVMALLAAAADRPITLGTVQGSLDFSAPRYRMTVALLGLMAPPAGVWSVTVSPLPTVL